MIKTIIFFESAPIAVRNIVSFKFIKVTIFMMNYTTQNNISF
ncbi:MAG: hypothetical protein ACOX56_00720 [Acholeplasmataceae bacterium]